MQTKHRQARPQAVDACLTEDFHAAPPVDQLLNATAHVVLGHAGDLGEQPDGVRKRRAPRHGIGNGRRSERLRTQLVSAVGGAAGMATCGSLRSPASGARKRGSIGVTLLRIAGHPNVKLLVAAPKGAEGIVLIQSNPQFSGQHRFHVQCFGVWLLVFQPGQEMFVEHIGRKLDFQLIYVDLLTDQLLI